MFRDLTVLGSAGVRDAAFAGIPSVWRITAESQQSTHDVTPTDHDRELAFWQAVVGGRWPEPTVPEYHGVDLPGEDFELTVQSLGEGPSRVHLDDHTDDLEAEVERLERVGARRVGRRGNVWVMQDPAGLLFCVIHDAEISSQNGHRWD